MTDEISDKVQNYYLSLTFKAGTEKKDIAALDKFMKFYKPCFPKNAKEQPVLSMELIPSNCKETLYLNKDAETGALNEFYVFNNETTARLIAKALPNLKNLNKQKTFQFIIRMGLGEAHWKYEGRTK